eukprot:1283312-Karenia_brevis.AAC.1
MQHSSQACGILLKSLPRTPDRWNEIPNLRRAAKQVASKLRNLVALVPVTLCNWKRSASANV